MRSFAGQYYKEIYTLDFILNLSDLSGHEKIKGTGYLYRVLLSMDSPCSEQSRELFTTLALARGHEAWGKACTHWVAKHC